MALTDTFAKNSRHSGKPAGDKHSDGSGLYLHVKEAGKYWRLNYRYLGKQKTLALGVYPAVSLAKARRLRDVAREQLAEGVDPTTAKRDNKRAKATAAASSFQVVALEWHAAYAKRWTDVTENKNLKHLQANAFPAFGQRPIAEVKPPEVLAMLRQVESRGAAYTATRVRELCSQVFRHAIATGKATYNPAADLLRTVVVPSVRHRPAITDRRAFGVFLRDLRDFPGADPLTKLATRLALLTFVRSRELRHARWDEIDLPAKEWRIPAARMKMGKGLNQAHVVPLSAQAIAVLDELRTLTGGGSNIFPSKFGADGFMSENTIGYMLKRMGYQGRQSLHGLRASARSLLSERGWSVAALERQLGHAERSKVAAAYARSEHLDERRRIMDDWGALVTALEAGENVVPFSRQAA